MKVLIIKKKYMFRRNRCGLHCIAWWLVWLGGINWGLVGLLGFDLIDTLFGGWSWLTKLIYVLVGLSAVVILLDSRCKKCRY